MGLEGEGATQVTGPECENSEKLLPSSLVEASWCTSSQWAWASSSTGQHFLMRVDGPLRASRTPSSGHSSECISV